MKSREKKEREKRKMKKTREKKKKKKRNCPFSSSIEEKSQEKENVCTID